MVTTSSARPIRAVQRNLWIAMGTIPFHHQWLAMHWHRYHWNGYHLIDARRGRTDWKRRLREGLRVPVGDRRRRFPTPLKAGKRARSGRLRTPVRRAIKLVIAHLLPAEFAPQSRRRRLAHDHQRRPPDRPSPARRLPPALRAAPPTPGRRPTPWSRSCPTTPGASTPSSGGCSTTGATTWTCVPCRRSPSTVAPHRGPSPWPVTWRCAPPGRIRHRQNPPVGGPRLSCKDRGVRGCVINSAGIDRIDGTYNKTGERNGVRGN